jgi:hypothetical protein
MEALLGLLALLGKIIKARQGAMNFGMLDEVLVHQV